MAYGLSASADGTNFPWVFIPPFTYWDGASVMVKHMAAELGGMDKLKGKKLGLIHLDAPFGKEPIPVLESLAKKYGFELKLYPVAAADMQNQGSLWLSIRRDRPDFLYNQGWGAMNPTAVKEAIKNNFPINKLVGVWWAGGDDDARAGGEQAKGYKSLSWAAAGTNFPVMQDILKYVVEKGKSTTPKDKVGEALYNRGVYNSMLVVEGIRNAQKLTGKKEGVIVLGNGNPGAASIDARQNGSEAGIKKYNEANGTNFSFEAFPDGSFGELTESIQKWTAKFGEKGDTLVAAIGTGNPTPIYQAMQEQVMKPGSIAVGSTDIPPAHQQAIADGWVQWGIDQQFYLMGFFGAAAAYGKVEGQYPYPAIKTGGGLITADNLKSGGDRSAIGSEKAKEDVCR